MLNELLKGYPVLLLYLAYLTNLVLVTLYAGVGAVCLTRYLAKRRPADGWTALLALCWLLDEAVIGMTELVPEFAGVYEYYVLAAHSLKTILLAGIFFCAGRLAQVALGPPAWGQQAVYIAYVAALVVLPIFPFTNFTYWLYYTLTQGMILYWAALVWLRLPEAARRYGQSQARALRWLLVATVVLTLGIVAEDTVMIFGYATIEGPDISISHRNTFEDWLRILLCVCILRLFSRRAAAPEPKPGRSLEDLQAFGQRWQLTPRELEVLALALTGESNEEISHRLHITLGTTKNHLHNLYQKCGVSRRSQMQQLVEQYQEEPARLID